MRLRTFVVDDIKGLDFENNYKHYFYSDREAISFKQYTRTINLHQLL